MIIGYDAQLIDKLRCAKNFTIKEFSNATTIIDDRMFAILDGEIYPTVWELGQICKVLEITPNKAMRVVNPFIHLFKSYFKK